MADLKQLFAEEIRRLARKEIRAEIAPLQKTISEQKAAIRELRKLLRSVAPAAVKVEKKADLVEPAEEVKVRLNAKGIVRIRTKLKLTQGQFAQVLGVSGHTVSIWELGKVSPRSEMKKKICALRTVGKRALAKLLADAEASEKVQKENK